MKFILSLSLSIFILSSVSLAEECTSNCDMYPTTVPLFTEDGSSAASTSTTSEYEPSIKITSQQPKIEKKLKAHYYCDVYNLSDCFIVYK